MSYDFTMQKIAPNETTRETFEEDEEYTNTPNLFDEEGRQRGQAIANAIQTINPLLHWKAYAIDRLEYLEIDGNDNDGQGVQISIFPNSISVTVPYWHHGEKARQVFSQIWIYLKVLQDMTDYVIYDPQVESLIQLDKDFKVVLATYSGGTDYVDYMLAGLNGG